MNSLWGEEFELPKEEVKKIIKKIKTPKKVTTPKKSLASKTLSIEEKLAIIKENVYKILGVYIDNTLVIKDRNTLVNYIDKCIDNKIIAIDTETNNSLDPITCKLMGACIYTPDMKAAYIPINHINKDTGERLSWQLTEKDIKEQFDRLNNNVKIIMHNGKFDYEVLKCTCNYISRIDWDTMIGAKLLDENEHSAGLKQQYITKIDPSIEKYDIENLFEHIEYAIVDPDIFALYAATDSMMTYKLYLWQMNKFNLPENRDLLNLANTVEMPLVHVIAEMEMSGMEIDQDYGKLLSAKYHKKLDDVDKKLAEELNKLKPKIDAWRLTEDANFHPKKKNSDDDAKSKNEQLTEPINLASPTQLAILFYDILKAPTVNRKKPRSTGEEDLKAIAEKLKLPLCNLILERRELVKLLTTYIDAIPELAKRWPDGRVRTHFNQYGAQTGRLSSSDPLNFQNIPSHNKEIRMLFKAKEGTRIVGGDFSAQEPRLTAFYSQDENMINAYIEGKDLYSVIASMSFDRKYEDCLEFYPEGTVIDFEGKKVTCGYKTHQNKEGKTYRTMAKSILLGVLYGRGAASVGEQIGKSRDEAQEIIDKFFTAFPKVKQWIEESKESAYKVGYVTDVAGRRRRLPDILLPKYEITDLSINNVTFNPLLGCADHINQNNQKIERYKDLLKKCRSKKEIDQVKENAKTDKIDIKDNSGFIAQAERQAVNARVQGGAATLTKCALITIYNDQRLRDINARLVNTVHDEILLEVPAEHSEEAEKLLTEDMVGSAKMFVHNVPMKTDTYNVPCWYLDEFFVLVETEFKKMLENGKSIPETFERECSDRSESTRAQIYEIVKGFMNNYVPENVDISYKSL